MKIVNELVGKEVIDNSGDKIGEVEDVELNVRNNKLEGIILSKGGLQAKIGMGEERMIPCSMVKTIGENVLLKQSGKSMGKGR